MADSVLLFEYVSLLAGPGVFPESIEVYPDETSWTVAAIRWEYHRAPLRAHCSATDSERRKFLIGCVWADGGQLCGG